MWIVKEKEREEELRRQNAEKGIIEKEEKENYQYEISTWRKLWYSPLMRGLLIIVALAIIIPIFLFVFLDMTPAKVDLEHSCNVVLGKRVRCSYNIRNEDHCLQIGCCFDVENQTCFHFLPSKYVYKSENWLNGGPFETTAKKNPFGVEMKQKIYVTVTELSETAVSIKLHEFPKPKRRNLNRSNPLYDVNVLYDPMAVTVQRLNNETVLSTSHGPTIVSDFYWEWSVDLNADILFGMDDLVMQRNSTKVFYNNWQNHTSVPKFMAYKEGLFHGLEIKHIGPLEVDILDSYMLVLRLLAGHEIELILSLGPTPQDVIKQLRGHTEPQLPPYWVFGAHICRSGNFNSIDKALQETDTLLSDPDEIGYDSDCIHENLVSLTMDYNENDMEKLKKMLLKLKNNGKKFMMSLTPQISTKSSLFDEAKTLNILYNNNSKPYIGSYLNKSIAYLDYRVDTTHDITESWFKALSFQFDGIVLHSNWPQNDKYAMRNSSEFCYLPENIRVAMGETIPWDSRSASGTKHIFNHNEYSQLFTNSVHTITNSKFMLSSSFSPTMTAGSHVQNINVTWVAYKQMLTQTMSFGLFGGNLFTIPICGSTSVYNEDINNAVCLRWYLTAATLPLFRVSSDYPRRDPGGFSSKFSKNIALSAIQIRYSLLPYFYTVMNEGMTLMRPMFVDFYKDEETLKLDEQYMLGEALLVAQPTLFPISHVNVYMPDIPGGWYEFWGGRKTQERGWNSVAIIETDLIIFIRSGYIVPMRMGHSRSAEESLKLPLKLAVALQCTTDACTASGTLFVSNSVTLEISANENSVQISNIQKMQLCNGEISAQISVIQVYGLDNEKSKLFNVNYDLCAQENDSVDIKYPSKNF